jgi:23S rRNA (adenine2030-N6)-methyltransferase
MLRQVMPYLVQVLGRDAGAQFTLESGEATTARKAPQRTT